MLSIVLFFVVSVAVGVVLDRYLRAPAPVPAPKPFGLSAFEAHGLNSASGDVLKAVVATISFLGHPFTVVAEAEEASARARARSAGALNQVDENLEAIRDLETENIELQSRAKGADARASELTALVTQVQSAVGGR